VLFEHLCSAPLFWRQLLQAGRKESARKAALARWAKKKPN
jgi:hypothetical protein